MTHDRYALSQRVLHWLIALLVIGTWLGGWLIEEFKAADFPKGVYNLIYAYHKSFGVVILALMLCRVLARLIHRAPPPHPSLTNFQRIASEFVHYAFYLLLIVQPVLGMLGTWAYPAPIPIFDVYTLPNPLGKDRELSGLFLDAHAIVAKVLLALAVVHIGAAVMHMLKKDGIIQRMGFGKQEHGTGGG